jgi:hypothetical protein
MPFERVLLWGMVGLALILTTVDSVRAIRHNAPRATRHMAHISLAVIVLFTLWDPAAGYCGYAMPSGILAASVVLAAGIGATARYWASGMKLFASGATLFWGVEFWLLLANAPVGWAGAGLLSRWMT